MEKPLNSYPEPIPYEVQMRIAEVIDILMSKGVEYETELITQKANNENYHFFFPKSPYYRHYISALVSREKKVEKQKAKNKLETMDAEQSYFIEGNIEDMSVGGMREIAKKFMSQGHAAYTPLDNQVYSHQINADANGQEMDIKASEILGCINSIFSKRVNSNPILPKEKPESKKVGFTKREEMMNEAETRKDGSLGAWGGKKYEGLGSRNAFHDFRRQKSQIYHVKLQDRKQI